MKAALFSICGLLICSTIASAEDCRAIKEAAARLACFDKEPSAPASAPVAPAAIAAQPAAAAPAAPAATAEAAPPALPKTFKVVDGSDLFVGTSKYVDRDIEMQRIKCYFADVNDYRCISTGVLLSVFSAKIEPPSAKKWLEERCDQLKVALTSSACVFNARFTFGADDVEEDVVSGLQQRKVIRPPGGLTMVPKTEKRRQ
jgi:hypothetical protein